MSTEAMKLAKAWFERNTYGDEAVDVYEALCEALAQPQQQPVLQDIEQYRLQMAGISTAAFGYWKEGESIHPDYDTLALHDVAKLYAKYDELYKAQLKQEPPTSAAKGTIMGAAYDFRDAHLSGSTSLKRSAHAALESAVDAALAEQPAKDEFKAAYIEAMVASNEAGFAGMSAAETIRELSRMVAEQPAQQEPVAWVHWLHGPVRLLLNKDEAQMELERLNREYPVDAGSRKMRPLVFGDTSPPARKPLTDEQIKNIAAWTLFPIAFARAIEAAHGIKGDA